MDQVAKQSTVDRLAQASNVLVTVSANPSVDQLAACIGLTLFLNKQGKHATAVFSGNVPSTLEFLQPDKTIEKNTDSLRDFIISLDKAKADKLRYKVENDVVRIFITPYRTSISEKDFDFSQGDFNVDVVMALGVHSKEELDHAIIAHGRILHDATVISVNNAMGGSLGTIDWQDQQASSLCEMLVELAEIIKPDSFDAQMATAFLTGIVAETRRFSNERTTSRTMSLSAKLMAAGANQQLVATQLQKKGGFNTGQDSSASSEEAGSDGTLEIDHEPAKSDKESDVTLPKPQPEKQPPEEPKSPINDVRPETGNDNASGLFEQPKPNTSPVSGDGPTTDNSQPSRGGTLTANTRPEDLSPGTDPMSQIRQQPLMQRGQPGGASDNSLGSKTISNIEDAVIDQDKTLADIEKSVGSSHATNDNARQTDNLNSARDAVAAAAAGGPAPRLEPRHDIGSQGRLEVGATGAPTTPTPASPQPAVRPVSTTPQTPAPPASQSPIPPDPGLPADQTGVSTAASPPPPVPPPMTPANLPSQQNPQQAK